MPKVVLVMLESMMICLWFLLSMTISKGTDIYEPTSAELRRAIQLQTPREGWGYQARQEKQVRLFVIGGSNTIGDMYFGPLRKYITDTALHPSWNGTVDRLAISGCAPQDFIGMKYKFESLRKHLWPNIIMLEFAMNVAKANIPTAAHSIDSVIRTFRFKYHHAELPEPDFMFFELFGTSSILYETSDKSVPPKTLSYKLERLTGVYDPDKTRGNGAFTGCQACPELRKVSDFYDYPVVSWHYPGFRAFLRWYLVQNQSFVDNPWLFTMDGDHISEYGGQYVTDHLFSVFFRDAMVARTELPAHQRISVPRELHMYPQVTRTFQVWSYTMWDTDQALNLRTKPRMPMVWSVVEREEHIDGHYHGNACIGSEKANSVVNVDFEVPSECSHIKTCRVSMGFVKSWNVTKYGNASCSLINIDTKQSVAPTMYVLSQVGEIDHTAVVQSVFEYTTPPGRYTSECRKLDDKLSCLATVSVVADVML